MRDFIFEADGQRLCVRGDVFRRCPCDGDGAVTLSEGFTVHPGIVDAHGDCFERHVAPRRGVLKTLEAGIIALDNELASNGITTAILPQFFSWQGGMRGPWFAEKFITSLREMQDELRTDMRVQLRLEMALMDEFDAAEELIERANIGYVVFNDNLPYRALRGTERVAKLTRQALRFGMEPTAYIAKLTKLAARRGEMERAVYDLGARLAKKNILLGYHDAESSDARELALCPNMQIAEFPQNLTSAKAALSKGCSVILGAPNIVRGASHYKKLSAMTALSQGACSALASDYHYPSLRLAAQKLSAELGARRAWALISEKPALCLGLHNKGKLAEGMCADLTILDRKGRVGATLARGRWSFLTDEVARHL